MKYLDELAGLKFLDKDEKAWWDAFWDDQLHRDWAATAGEYFFDCLR